MEQQADRMLKWFTFAHLPPHLQAVSAQFTNMATYLCNELTPGQERTVALRKLLEAKDAAVRQAIEDHEKREKAIE